MNCWYGGGFYAPAAYDRDALTSWWTLFDADRNGWLTADEYWSAAAWTRLDVNRNARLDANEWRWW